MMSAMVKIGDNNWQRVECSIWVPGNGDFYVKRIIITSSYHKKVKTIE